MPPETFRCYLDIQDEERAPCQGRSRPDGSTNCRRARCSFAWTNGHFNCTSYHPLFLFNQFGDLEYSMLRYGN